MKRLILLIILFCALPAMAQSVPSQFAGLMTNTTDYTLNGTVWTTPSMPAAGTCAAQDPTWLTTTCRITSPTDCQVSSSGNPTGDCSLTTTHMVSDYPKVDPWSADSTYFAGIDTLANGMYIYTVSNGTYTFLRRMNTSDTKYGAARDHADTNGFEMGSDTTNWLWANTRTDHIIYYTGSTIANAKHTQLKAYNVDTDTITVVHDFGPTIATVASQTIGGYNLPASGIDMQREGNQSDDDRYWVFMITDGSNSSNTPTFAVVTYDKLTDTEVSLKYTGENWGYNNPSVPNGLPDGISTGLCGNVACPATGTSWKPINWVGVSPSGNYFIVSWGQGTKDTQWIRGTGNEIYDKNLNFLGVATGYNGHGDVGYDSDRVEIFVTLVNPYSLGGYEYTQIGMCKLSAVTSTPGPTSIGGCETILQLPCTYGYTNCAAHTGFTSNYQLISMRGSHGAALGWMLWSSWSHAMDTTTGRGGFGALENFAVKLEWSAGANNYNLNSPVTAAPVVRIARSHTISSDSTDTDVYWAQPNAAPNHDFTKIAWTSTWDNVPLSSDPQGPFYSVYTELTGGGSTEDQITVSAAPNPANLDEQVTLTATVAQTGSAAPTGTINFLNGTASLGTASLGSSGIAILTVSTLPVGSYAVVGSYSGDSNYPPGQSGLVSLQVVNATTTSLAASPNPVIAGQALALTATVEGSDTTSSSGTVSFLNGSTPLGTATLNASGVATLSTTSLAAGTYSLTAQYAGNASFLSSTSAAVTVTVNAQATEIVESFSLNARGSTSQTVQPGGTAVYTLGVSPAIGTTLPAINFVVSGLPAGATATFSPQAIPAGNRATNVTLSIQTSVQSAMLERNRKLGGGLVVALGILLLPFGGGIRRSGKCMLRLSYLELLLAGAVSLAGLTGCAVLNVPGAFSSASAQTYNVTVTSTAASLSQTTTVTLIVE